MKKPTRILSDAVSGTAVVLVIVLSVPAWLLLGLGSLVRSAADGITRRMGE